MPAGGGAGGGCGGGGGGGGGYYNNYHNSGEKESSPAVIIGIVVGCVVVSFLIICLLVGIPLSTSSGHQTNGPVEVPVFFSPGDSRVVSFGSFFCDKVTLVDKSRSTEATLYLITDTPPLTDQNNFTIYSSLALSDNIYNYWNYYLYPGSNVTTTIRTRSNSDSGTFYLFKGRNSFQQWINNPNKNQAIETFSIQCSSSFNRHFSYTVQDEDEYYLVYYNRRGQQCTNFAVLRLDVTISVSRFQYSTEDLTTAASCSAIKGECSLNVPAHPNYNALIVTDIPNDPDWEENVDVTLHCSSNREWAYAVVVLIPLLVIVGVSITAVIILACVCKRSCHRQR